MKKSILVLGICMILLMAVMPMISAMTINVKTLPNHKASIFVVAPTGVYSLIDSQHLPVGADGKVSMTYSGSKSEVSINIKITKDGKQILFEKLGNFPTSSDVYLQLIPDDISLDYKAEEDAAAAAEAEALNVTNDTEKTEETLETTETEEDAPSTNLNSKLKEGIFTGLATIKNSFVAYSKIIYYLLGAIVLAVAATLFFRHKSKGRGFSLGKKKDYIEVDESNSPFAKKKLAEAESKIKEAQAEIDAIKNRGKEVEEAKRKFEESKREFEKLGGKTDPSQ